MLKFLEKFFSLKSSSKKQKVLIVFLLFLFFFLLYPISCAQASWGWLQWIPERIANAIAGLALTAVLALAQGILNLGIILFNWSLSGIPVSYTNPAGNEVIRVGWTLVRDIANIGLVLGLIYIGLATALRIAGFETKKAFVWFLIMALLVNFTPVICGIIVDASNIVMNFFLRGPGGWERLNSVFDEQRAIILQYALGEPNWVLYIKVMVLAAFGFVTGLIFILYGLLFFLRNPIIWLLVIFSPLAFVAYIFPKTRGWFERWWNQLLQWSFIGAIAGFFLYLAQYTFLLAAQGKLATGGTPENIFNELAPYLVAVVFLGLGLYASTMTSAMGASAVIGVSKRIGKGIVGGAWTGTKLGASKLRAWLRKKPKASEEEEEFKRKHPRLAKLKQGGKTLGKFFFGGLTPEEKERWGWKWRLASGVARGVAAPFTLGATIWGRRATTHFQTAITESLKNEIDKKTKEAQGKSLDYLAEKITKPLSKLDRIAALLAAIKDKKVKDLMSLKGITKGQIKNIMKDALKVYPPAVGGLKKINPYWAKEVAEKSKVSLGTLAEAGLDFTQKDREAGFKDLAEKLTASAKPKDIEDFWDKETITRAATSEAFHKFATGAQVAAAGRAWGRVFFEAFQKGKEEIMKKHNLKNKKELEDWYKKYNAPLHSYLKSSAAARLGVGIGVRYTPPTPAPPVWKEHWEMTKEELKEVKRKKPDTGEARARRRKKPDVGKP